MSPFDQLPQGALVAIDTAPVIYLLERREPFADHFKPLFQRIQEGTLRGILSPITVAEVTAGPLAHGDDILAERYYRALLHGANLQVQEMTAEIGFKAARFRARYGLKLSDAIQLATAVHAGASALVTHDRGFGKVTELPIIGL